MLDQVRFGLSEVKLTGDGRADPLFNGLGRVHMVFHWHRYSFDRPSSATCLETDESASNQVIRFGKRVYGLEYYLGVSPPVMSHWRRQSEGATCLSRHLGEEAFNLALLRMAQPGWFQIYERQAKRVLANFLSLVMNRR
jgi:hypothetical protein